jgi:hypothetical protein
LKHIRNELALAALSGYTTSTARCGNTYTYRKTGGTIAIAINRDCLLAGGLTILPNPDFRKVTAHEKGHAFALALGKSHGQLAGPDRSSGYKALGTHDRNNIGSTGTICAIFGQFFPSTFESDLQAGAGQVCSSTTQVTPSYSGLTAKQIHDIRAPYFVNPAAADQYAELWAEQVSMKVESSKFTTRIVIGSREADRKPVPRYEFEGAQRNIAGQA